LAIQVVFHRLAAKEARAAEAWYANRSPEVAQQFRSAVLSASQRIADDIGTHPIGKSRFHYVVVRRFPYRLIYCFDSESTARVVAVTHLRRRPGYWSRRGSP
jgi:plasmid stabilization system protein ParE